MDFSKFRDTGELSDITVVVDGNEYKLHKFPLFIKSDFFRALARSKITERDRVELADFPGGADTFEEVGNYFYNIKLNITKDNVCKLRCAAEFLQMTSSANLADHADRFLHDALTSAKLGRNLPAITDLLLQCCDLGAIAEQAGVVNKCIEAIVDCWLISTKFVRRNAQLDKTDLANLEKLAQFPLEWFLKLFITARDKAVRPAVLATLIELYVNNALSTEQEEEEKELEVEDLKGETKQDATDGDEKEKESQQVDGGEQNGDIAPPSGSEENGNAEETNNVKEKESDDSKPQSSKGSKNKPSDEDVGKVLDTLLQELPENTPLAETISPKWALKMLKMSDKLSTRSRTLLLKLVACLLHKFSPADLSQVSPDMLSEILAQAGKDQDNAPGQKDAHTNMACQVIDNYLLEQAKADELPLETFVKMSQAVPPEHRTSHDTVFNTLELLLKSEKIKISEEEKKPLIDQIDFERLSESTLQRAYDAELVPGSYITKAALALCSKLRGDLETAKNTIKSQQEELSKYGLGQKNSLYSSRAYVARPYDTHPSSSAVGSRTGTSTSSKFTPISRASKRITASHVTSSAPANQSALSSSLDPDLELKLALDDLDREYRYGSGYDYGRGRYLEDSRDSPRDSYSETYGSLYSRRPGHWGYAPKS